ncbi:DUF6350 family protein [Streptomyces sp. ST2-7A]|uniref:cell division protein PerM n=1 Tax=Streptomyces sp. ST2-7A TaxID=2907214 RepID=UPI001F3E5CB1|nr:DUF6350 family protein [Streptomyces sp. ST2-7A]MCE7078705.1 DUF6350 family protein [Streptomyces sp. ST2-7A]
MSPLDVVADRLRTVARRRLRPRPTGTTPSPSGAGRPVDLLAGPLRGAGRHPGALLDGAVAAVLGIGVPAVIVLMLWTTSPHPDAGAAAALRTAIDLWLLAHGTPLERVDTLHGAPAPLALTPLLLTALPVWLLWRAVRTALTPGRPPGEAVGAAVRVSLGYAAAGVPAILFAAAGPLRASPPRALGHLLLLALVVTVVAALRSAEPPAPTGRLAPLLRHTGNGALRAAGAGVAGILGAGALLGAVALIGGIDTALADFTLLARDWSGRVALVLLLVALLPNLAVWAAAHGLGPGFALGGGTLTLGPLPALVAGRTIGPITVPVPGDPPPLPAFPLLAALPGPGPAGPVELAAATAVPLVGGVLTGVVLGRAAVPRRSDRATAAGAGDTVLAALAASVTLGALLAVAAGLAGGPVGVGRLAEFGPSAPWTGIVAGGWTLLLGLPVALSVRAVRLGRPGPGPGPGPGSGPGSARGASAAASAGKPTGGNGSARQGKSGTRSKGGVSERWKAIRIPFNLPETDERAGELPETVKAGKPPGLRKWWRGRDGRTTETGGGPESAESTESTENDEWVGVTDAGEIPGRRGGRVATPVSAVVRGLPPGPDEGLAPLGGFGISADPRSIGFPPVADGSEAPGAWHAPDARRSRWAALRHALHAADPSSAADPPRRPPDRAPDEGPVTGPPPRR